MKININKLNKIFENFLFFQESAWKNALGVELTEDVATQLHQIYPKLPTITKFSGVTDKISWMIKYMDIMDNLGMNYAITPLKISNISTITYLINNEWVTNPITLAIGDTNKGNLDLNSNHGLYHMKYGKSNHWELSKQALYKIPKSLKSTKIRPAKDPYKYEIWYKDKRNNYLYVIGIPSNKGDATVLITCQKIS